MENKISQLVAEYKNGNIQASQELYNLTVTKMFNMAYSILGTNNRQDAEDVVQESYMSAFMNINQLNDPSKFNAWLTTIVANNAKAYLSKRKNNKLFVVLDEDDANCWTDENFSDTSFIEHQNNTEKSEIILSIINSLPDEQRICIVMYYYNQMPVSEIATALGVPEGTVKSRLHKARLTIKAEVEKLEQNGTKLYGVGIGASIFAALNTKANATQPSATLAQKLFSQANNTINTNTAVNTAKSATAVAKKRGVSMGAKIALGVVGVAILAGIIITVVSLGNKPEIDTPVDTDTTIIQQKATEEITETEESTQTATDSNATDVVAIDNKGLTTEISIDDLMADTGIKKENISSLSSEFITDDIIKVTAFQKEGDSKTFLFTTEGKQIDAGDFTRVVNTTKSFANMPSTDYAGRENYFNITYKDEEKEYNIFGLMDINGDMVIKDEYAYITVISPTYALAYKAVEQTSDDQPICPTLSDVSNDYFMDTTGVIDIYNVKTGKKLDKASGIKMTDNLKIQATADYVCLQYSDVDENQDGSPDIIAYDKDGKEFDFEKEYGALSNLEEICEFSPAYNPVTLSIETKLDETTYSDVKYLVDKDGKQVSDEYYDIKRVNDYFVTMEITEEGPYKYGIIDSNGKVISECKFDEVHYPTGSFSEFNLFESGLCLVTYEEKLAYINLNGEFVTEPVEFELPYGYQGYLLKVDRPDIIDEGSKLLTPSGVIVNGENGKWVSSISSNSMTYVLREEKGHADNYTLYDYMSNPLFTISNESLLEDCTTKADISVNATSTFATAVTTDNKIILYSIEQAK